MTEQSRAPSSAADEKLLYTARASCHRRAPMAAWTSTDQETCPQVTTRRYESPISNDGLRRHLETRIGITVFREDILGRLGKKGAAAMNSLYRRMETWRPYILSILRMIVGLLLLQHGLSKVFNFPAPSPVGALSGVLILAAILETIGAALFLVGAFTRIVAFILSGEMAFAYFMAHAPRSFYPIVNATIEAGEPGTPEATRMSQPATLSR